jgi:hypothetical protein
MHGLWGSPTKRHASETSTNVSGRNYTAKFHTGLGAKLGSANSCRAKSAARNTWTQMSPRGRLRPSRLARSVLYTRSVEEWDGGLGQLRAGASPRWRLGRRPADEFPRVFKHGAARKRPRHFSPPEGRRGFPHLVGPSFLRGVLPPLVQFHIRFDPSP